VFATVDEHVEVLQSRSYSPFGNISGENGEISGENGEISGENGKIADGNRKEKTGDSGFSPCFASGFCDGASGLVYMRNRFLLPEVAAFLTPDPLGRKVPLRNF
jgi:hypothetical protein